MSRIAYVSGRYVRHRAAFVHIEDRGYQFADGVYEVVAIHNGRIVDEALHLNRLARSLGELKIAAPVSERVLKLILRRVVELNRLRDGSLYLQITRGVAPREHAFPLTAQPQLVITAKHAKPVDPDHETEGVKAITIPDIRWDRRDIKSVSLLPNILGKQQAKEQGAYEAWQVDEEGNVTEGTSSNAWIVTMDGEIVTRPASTSILNGITRIVAIKAAREAGMKLVERCFSVAEAKAAKEAFITGTTSLVIPVTQVDDQVIGNGKPGSFTLALRELMIRERDRLQ